MHEYIVLLTYMPVPSYQSDALSHSTGHVPVSRDSGVIGLHEENLFDEDERSSDGARYDESTGEPYDNSTFTDEQLITEEIGHIVDADNPDAYIAVDPEELALDAAADVWLAMAEGRTDQLGSD